MQAQISNDLIASYDFNGNVNDASGNNWNGSPQGGPTYDTDRFGNASKSLKLDGVDDKVLFGNLPIHGNFSISLWLNAPSTGLNTSQQSIISKRLVCGVGSFFDVRGLSTSAPNSVNIEALNGSGVSGNGAGATINKNEWMHVVYVFDSLGKKTNVYIDGLLFSTRTWDASFKTVNNTASFGIGNSPCVGRPYLGLMNDLRVYKGPLNANAVTTLYNEDGFCKAIGGTISLSENKVLNTSPNNTYVGKITKSKLDDIWLFPADSADNQYFTFRNDSLFTNNLTKSNSVVLFVLDNCEKKVQKFDIEKGDTEIFLISKYSFSNNLTDESGNGFNGNYYITSTISTPTYVNDRSASANSAIPLNGVNDFYQLGDQPWDYANLSISFWMKPLNNTKNYIVFSKREVCGVGNFIDVRYNTDGTLGAEIRNGDGSAHVSSTANTLLPANQWHHVVIVLDRAKSKSFMYVNGVLANSLDWDNFSSLANDAQFTLGMSPCAVNNIPPFNGHIDDITVYGLPITQSEVTALYSNNTITGTLGSESVEKSIYPNPATDYVFVTEYAEVYDMLGNKVAEGSEKINLTHLAKGIYLVKSGSKLSKILKD